MNNLKMQSALGWVLSQIRLIKASVKLDRVNG